MKIYSTANKLWYNYGISEVIKVTCLYSRRLRITGLSIIIFATIAITPDAGSNSFEKNSKYANQELGELEEQPEYAELQLVHSSADPAVINVDVYLNESPSDGDPVIADFSYQEATEFFDISVDDKITIILTVAGSDEIIYSDDLAIEQSGSYAGIIRGDLEVVEKSYRILRGHTDLGVELLEVQKSTDDADKLPLLFFHSVTDYSTIDVWGEQRNIYAENLSFGESSADYVHFPTGILEFNYHDTGTCPGFDSPLYTFEEDTGAEADVTGIAIISGYAELSTEQDLPATELMVVYSDGRTTFPQNITSVETGPDSEIPSRVALNQNYPNPFNSMTKIEYQVPVDTYVELSVYSLLGRHIKTLVNTDVDAGTHRVSFDGSNITSGVYLYRLQADNEVITNRMMLIK